MRMPPPRAPRLRAKYGPHIGWRELQQILADRTQVRYPCEIIFDAGPLDPGEFAHLVPKGEVRRTVSQCMSIRFS